VTVATKLHEPAPRLGAIAMALAATPVDSREPSPSEPCYPAGYDETYTVTLHWRERINAQIDAAGGLRIWQQAATETCEPAVVGCGISVGGGA
jgi:hypothetical protein